MIDRILSLLTIVFAGFLGGMFYFKNKQAEKVEEIKKDIEEKKEVIENEIVKMSDSDLDKSITDKLKG